VCGIKERLMAFICVRKSDGKLIEAQSHATKGTLIANAVSAGYAAKDVEEREVSEAAMNTAIATQIETERVVRPASEKDLAIAEINKLVAKKTMDPNVEAAFIAIKNYIAR
jgi:hypothetical protein